MKKIGLLLMLCLVWMVANANAGIIYYDNFNGTAGTDLNGTLPDISSTGASWVAGTNFDADGTVTYPTGDTTMGDTAYLPFVPVQNRIYELSAMIDTRKSVPRNNANDWIALGFTQSSDQPDRRFFDDNGTRSPIYWGATRTNVSTSFDFTVVGPGNVSNVNTATISADNIKIVLNCSQPTWTVSWYFNDAWQRTENVTLDHALFQYVAMTNARADGFIRSFALVEVIPEPATMLLLGIGSILALRRRK